MLSTLIRRRHRTFGGAAWKKDIILEDEVHILRDCVLYKELRSQLDIEMHERLKNDNISLFTEEHLVTFSNFLKKYKQITFP